MDPLERLQDRCRRLGVRLVYAAERGSRAYGTEDPGSDWDIQAVVALDPQAYCSVAPPPPVWTTSYEGLVSTTLFNVPRAALMLVKGKVKLREAAYSDCVLHDEGGIGARMRALSEAWFEPRVIRQQYLAHMENAVAALDPKGERAGKRWLHLLLPMLSERLAARTGTFPPITLAGLLAADPDPFLAAAAREALAAKRGGRDVDFDADTRARLLAQHAACREGIEGERIRLKPETMQADLIAMANAFAWDVIGLPPAPSPAHAPGIQP